MKRPSIKSPCVADRHHSPIERIAEVTFPDGTGCLVSLRGPYKNGECVIDVYRADPNVVLLADERIKRTIKMED